MLNLDDTSTQLLDSTFLLPPTWSNDGDRLLGTGRDEILLCPVTGEERTDSPAFVVLAASAAPCCKFSVHNRIRTQTADAESRQRLARYMIRCPFALDKMSYDRKIRRIARS